MRAQSKLCTIHRVFAMSGQRLRRPRQSELHASGDVTNDGVNQYLYDGDGRICAVSNTNINGVTQMTGYLYNAEGIRVAKGSITLWSCDVTANGFQTKSDYIIGPGGAQITEMASDGVGGLAWQHTNVWAAGQLIATFDKDSVSTPGAPGFGPHYYFNDWLGSRRVQTDGAGVYEQSCQSLPYGDGLNCSGSLTTPTEHHFTGKERDQESGNDYFRARYYASTSGRFLSPDKPFIDQSPSEPQSWNLYQYVRNNPLVSIDPRGTDCVSSDGKASSGGNSGSCGKSGGTWVPGQVDQENVLNNNGTFQVASTDGDTVYYSKFKPGTRTGDDGKCLDNCSGADIQHASKSWLENMLVDQATFHGMLNFMATRTEQLHAGTNPSTSWWSKLAAQLYAGPLLFWNDHWAGPGGAGAPHGKGDWAAMVHDYNFRANNITIKSYFNPNLSQRTRDALILSNENLVNNSGFGWQAFKEAQIFGAVNERQLEFEEKK